MKAIILAAGAGRRLGIAGPKCMLDIADVVFDRRLIQRLQSSPASSTLTVETSHCADEEAKVIVRDGKITRINKKLDPADCLGEFVGVARFGSELAEDFVKTIATIVEQEGVINEYFEYAVDRLCPHYPLTPVDISDLPCKEIDFPEDLLFVREKIAPRLIS